MLDGPVCIVNNPNAEVMDHAYLKAVFVTQDTVVPWAGLNGTGQLLRMYVRYLKILLWILLFQGVATFYGDVNPSVLIRPCILLV
jgi:hypothetical protein